MAFPNYNRNSGRPSLGGFSYFPPVIKWLLVSNIGIFLAEVLFGSLTIQGEQLGRLIPFYGALFPIGSPLFHVWQPITYMFLHASITHVLLNMFALWMFGIELENTWGSKKFLTYYTLCGLGGAAAHMLLSQTLGGAGPLVGASAAIFGLLIAFGLLNPDRMIYFYFLIPIRAKYFVMIYIGIELWSLLGSAAGDNVSHLAHLGGALVGVIYILIDAGGPQVLSRLRSPKSGGAARSPWNNPIRMDPPDRASGGFSSRPRPEEPVEAEYYDLSGGRKTQEKDSKGTRVITQAEIDQILDKIAASGYQNLSNAEREILFEAAKKMDEKR